VAVETLGPLSDEAHRLIAEIRRRAILCTADPRESTFLYQRILVAIQLFNAVCLLIIIIIIIIISFRVPIVTIPTYIFTFANFKTLGMKY